MNADGTGQTRITSNGYPDVDPAWSPDGQKLAFTSFIFGSGDSNSEIFVMNADGSGRTGLTINPGADAQPCGARFRCRRAKASARMAAGRSSPMVRPLQGRGRLRELRCQPQEDPLSIRPTWFRGLALARPSAAPEHGRPDRGRQWPGDQGGRQTLSQPSAVAASAAPAKRFGHLEAKRTPTSASPTRCAPASANPSYGYARPRLPAGAPTAGVGTPGPSMTGMALSMRA